VIGYRPVMRILIVALAFAACSSKPSPESPVAAPPAASPPASQRPPSVTDDMVAKSDRVIDAIEKLANDVGVAADCPSATAALRGHRDAMRAIMADADELEKRWSAADDAGKQWFETTYRPRF